MIDEEGELSTKGILTSYSEQTGPDSLDCYRVVGRDDHIKRDTDGTCTGSAVGWQIEVRHSGSLCSAVAPW